MATASYEPKPIPLARPASTIRVVRYNPKADEEEGESKFSALPNVLCLSIEERDGADLPTAHFRYVFDPNTLGPEFPSRIEDIIGLDKSGPYVVDYDDRICVTRDRADGGYQILFDGFAQVPQANLSDAGESVSFQAVGVAIRLR